ncbi:hypothetical protein [Pelagibacterium montanilacus]|uniref:hypothetical protein n=1 Tax=Pelagibacterium montanilacus TaxID=2185280 RepID=UPI000F8C8D5E|nr:hypothetical protein [Pelagibacterium montanilacus]
MRGHSPKAIAAIAAATVLATALAGPAQAQFPREGVAGIENGVSTTFAGKWWIGFPEGEGIIVGAPVVSCEDPVALAAPSAGVLVYHSPTGAQVSFEVFEFSGRTTWMPESGESILAVWTGPDEFFSYRVDAMSGSALWDDPRVYRRCPDAG